MGKKDIGKILTTGSTRQRLLLIVEDIARGKYFQERLLTESEFNQLSDSFKKPNEIKLWREFKEIDETITNALVNLQGLLYDVKRRYSDLRGYILTWNAIENAETLVNSVLHEIRDVKERRRIAKDGAKGVNLLFSETFSDEEGYINIDIDFEEDSYEDEDGKPIGFKDKPRKTKKYCLWEIMNNVKRDAQETAIKYLSWESAILDYMDEKGFNVKTYKTAIRNLTKQVYEPVIGWGKYYGKLNTGVYHPRLEELLKQYSICPDIKDLKIDEDQYTWFRRYFLDGSGRYPDELRGKLNKNILDE